MKPQPKLFANDGFGWRCLACSSSSDARSTGSRLMSEGEAECKQPALSETAMAKWTNHKKNELVCPKCHASESLDD